MSRSSKSRKPGRSVNRVPLTKEMLLPIPIAIACDVSLENHLALVALRTGSGNLELIGRLFKAVFVSYFLHVEVNGCRDLERFRSAEAALHRSAIHTKAGQVCLLPDSDNGVLAQILTLHDQQLASLPSHLIVAARDRLNRFLMTDVLSPIAPEGDVNP